MKKIIWFDFENAPHAWVFKELISSLSDHCEMIVTSRNFSSTVGISKLLNIPNEVIGKFSKSKSNLGKFFSVVKRSFLLRKYLINRNLKPSLSISHCSRSQALASFLMGIPQIFLDDYEHAFNGFHIFAQTILTPFPIGKEAWGRNAKKVVHYPGLKEQLYLWNEKNWNTEKINYVKEKKINVIFRPEGYTTHYSSKKSQFLQDAVIDLFSKNKNLHIILISRDKFQEKNLIELFDRKNIDYSIPIGVVNGPALIFQSDAVIGGGGTMTREACALNVPSYSFFGGEEGDVDKYLESRKLLKYIKEINDVNDINLVKKNKQSNFSVNQEAFNFVRDFLIKKLLT